ncbi:MAG: Ni/Fe-hydrogenase, b-type cytochrome subunit [Caldimicrobium sp.]|nr:Ni/Fe-hydrogenase, b-type cytochrome subunit [Caldimicrobium sp.]MCX7873378.1 Ni/Fe-hydrogenase, b-type cytochrome subunit [Caldimicrobium sp.]MDW8093792.1 Ni/Fe-hydrogenase, b-type cytochrome subunit [Caldimicrobium sp.]
MNINEKGYQKIPFWSWSLRIFHWLFALATITLIITGLYINNPPTTTSWSEFSPSYLMTTMRHLHFIAGFFFISTLILRIYLLFFGNLQEKATSFLPLRKANFELLKSEIKYYFYLSSKKAKVLGHTQTAGITYTIVFIISIIMAITGLYMLYPENPFFKTFGTTLFGTPQLARLIHYLMLWVFCIFILVHLYMAIWNEIKDALGVISSMISGSKYIPIKEKEVNSSDIN